MQRNPAHCLLSKQPIPGARLLTSREQKSYFLIPLGNVKNTLTLQSNTATLTNHHLSVYQLFSHQQSELGAFHYTATYTLRSKPVIIHVYFNHLGEYLHCHVRKKNEETLKLTQEEQQAIWQSANSFIQKPLNAIFQNLLGAKTQAAAKRTQLLNQLEECSKTSTTNQAYKKTLKAAISAIDEDNQLDFYPNESIKQILHKHLQILESNESKSDNNPPERQPLEASEAKHSACLITTTADVVVDAKELDTSAQLISNDFCNEEKRLYSQLNQCNPKDLSNILSITKQIDALEVLRQETIVQACIDGDQKTLDRLLQVTDTFFIASLASTCIYHNQPQLFDYLYPKNKFKQTFFVSPYKQAKPLKLSGNISHLYIAYEHLNLPFFKKLLDEYHYNPNEHHFLTNIPLLNSTVTDEKTIEFTAALLKAGANPNHTMSSSQKKIIITESSENKDLIEQTLQKIESHAESMALDTPLHTAAAERNIETIKLLLEYKADSTLRNKKGFTPFGIAIESTKPLQPRIIDLFIQKGHSIDERQNTNTNPTTALYYACQRGHINSVQILLGYNADPCVVHEIKSVNNGIFVPMKATPLSVAVNKEHIDIVKILLIKPIPRKEIQRALLCCRGESETSKILRRAYVKACNSDGIKASSNKDYALAKALFSEGIAKCDSNAECHSLLYNLGCLLYDTGNPMEALALFNQSLEIREKLVVDNKKLMPQLEKVQKKILKISSELASETKLTFS